MKTPSQSPSFKPPQRIQKIQGLANRHGLSSTCQKWLKNLVFSRCSSNQPNLSLTGSFFFSLGLTGCRLLGSGGDFSFGGGDGGGGVSSDLNFPPFLPTLESFVGGGGVGGGSEGGGATGGGGVGAGSTLASNG